MSMILPILLLLLALYILAVLTEEFFVPAIDIITQKLKLSSDAAGATLLAMGSSAPEFFTSLIAVLGLAGAHNSDIGAGTIVGSAIFNVLVIVGAAAMFKAVKLQWKPVMRDLLFYIVTILLLLGAFWDGKIVLYEALFFVFMYVLYVFFVVNWRKWLKYEDTEHIVVAESAPNNKIHMMIRKVISVVVPNPLKKPKYYLMSFLLSILAIAALSWVLVTQVVSIATVLNINSTFLALTVLAAGTSIPDLIGSVVVAKQGRGDMAVSNAIGSNVFDILFGLGVPWLIYMSLHGGQAVVVGTENLFASIFLLVATVVAILFILIVRNWKIGHKSGMILIGVYIAYCIYIAASVI